MLATIFVLKAFVLPSCRPDAYFFILFFGRGVRDRFL